MEGILMPRIHDTICIGCGRQYKGRGKYYCSTECAITSRRGETTFESLDNAVALFDRFLPYYDPILEVKKNSLMVCADLHLPFVNKEIFANLIKVAKLYIPPPRTIIITGDLMDFASISKFDVLDKETDVDNNLISSRLALNILATTFDEIIYTMGNHDIRYMKKLDWFVSVDELAGNLIASKKLKISPYPYIDIVSNGVEYHVTHPNSYSRVGKVPVDLAIIYRKSVLSFHGHLFSIRCEPSGIDIGYDVGCMTQQDYHGYVLHSETNHPRWTLGFCMIRNGTVYPFTMNHKITDWNFWLKELPGFTKKGKLF
jgi:hypothetical protein